MCVEAQLPLPITQRTHCYPHTEEERAWGYVIVKVHEVWHFSDQRSDLFKGYINTFLKIKQEASGWPWTWVRSRRNVEAYEQKEGIRLDESKIEKTLGYDLWPR